MMKIYRRKLSAAFIFAVATVLIVSLAHGQDDDTTRNVLKQGLLGAGTGAIAAGASGGDAGKGALIGAGTGAIGGILLDAMTTPSSSAPRRRRAAPSPDEDYYYEDEPEEEEYYYEEPPQESGTQKVLKQGLLGAGTGAIAAGASGGDAGKGALIGAGTGVIGGALLDSITQPSQQPRRVYRRAPRQRVQTQTRQVQQVQPQQQVQEETAADGSRKKVIKKYDDTGKLVSEEEIYY